MRAVTLEGAPLSGALVALVDNEGKVIVEGMTDSEGSHTLAAPAGRYKARVRRVGYEPFISAEFSIPYNGVLNLEVPTRRISLQTVVVTSGTACRRNDPDQHDIGVIWEEISKALVSTQLTRTDFAGSGSVVSYEMRIKNNRVEVADTTRRPLSSRPFAAIDPAYLATSGYVRGDIYSGWTYFAPDEAVLLSPGFANTHCFKVARDRKRQGQIGLRFEPQPGRRIPDISGAVWLDEKSGELREVVFRFVNIGTIAQFDPGGHVRFRRMPSGAWLVDDWKMRFPVLALNLKNELVEIGYSEHGGSMVTKR